MDFSLVTCLSDDDAINATQKMTRNVAIGAIAGAIGGYFAGRAIDKKVSYARAPDSLTRSLAQAKAVEIPLLCASWSRSRIKSGTAKQAFRRTKGDAKIPARPRAKYRARRCHRRSQKYGRRDRRARGRRRSFRQVERDAARGDAAGVRPAGPGLGPWHCRRRKM